ncbi:MAG: ZIP family metal transporter [bacterium]|nr:ZIP family metal transporter [bacterium]
MDTLLSILLLTFLGSIASLTGGVALLANKAVALKLSRPLTSFAAGALLGAAFFDLLPEALHESKNTGTDIFLWTLAGLLLFFFVERILHWTHHHDEDQHDPTEQRATVPLIIIGDTLHNFVDGIAIGATTLASLPLGIVTTLAVAAHEIPQEMGDFGLLLHKGVPRKMVLLVNILSAAVAFIGALLAYVFGSVLQAYIPAALGLTAGFFIYIATSDILPEMHRERRYKFALMESSLLIAGIIFVYFSMHLLPE